jgi:hypothetical protein
VAVVEVLLDKIKIYFYKQYKDIYINIIKMIENRRHGNRWTINETLALQREYELLGWDVEKIANKHQRSVISINYKLESEGFDAKKYQDSLDSPNNDNDEEFQIVDNVFCGDDEESEIDTLTKRIWSLETNVDAISLMVKNIYNILSDKKNSKRKPLRNASA